MSLHHWQVDEGRGVRQPADAEEIEVGQQLPAVAEEGDGGQQQSAVAEGGQQQPAVAEEGEGGQQQAAVKGKEGPPHSSWLPKRSEHMA